MYAHQPGAIKDLEKCRVNPDFKSKFRDDLEFYIPQICSFFLKGNQETSREQDDLYKVIILASQTNFFFAHRIWFFFHSAMFKEFNQSIYHQSQQILKGLKGVCLDNENEKMYIANSESITVMIIELFMSDFYSGIHSDSGLMHQHYNMMKMDEDEKRIYKEKQFGKMVTIEKVIKKYKKHDEAQQQKNEKMGQGSQQSTINQGSQSLDLT